MSRWNFAIAVSLIAWLGMQASPRVSEQVEDWRCEFRDFWSFHRRASHQLLPGERPQDMIDDAWSRRVRARVLLPVQLPPRAIAHPTRPRSYFLDGQEFSQ